MEILSFTTYLISINLIKLRNTIPSMKKLSFFLLINILLISSFVSAEIYISEIMYNPDGDDNNKEYVEIYSDKELDNYSIEDLSSLDYLEKINNFTSNFSLIVEEGFNFSGVNAKIYSVGATIGNNLNNDVDSIVLRDTEGKVLDAISYSKEIGGDGRALCVSKNKIISECIPTPGYSTLEITYDVRLNEFLPDPAGDDDAFMPAGEWIELYNPGDFDIDLNGFSLKDKFGHQIFITDSQVLDSTTINKRNFLVVYVNGKSGFLNNDDFEEVYLIDDLGVIIDKVSYSGSQEDVSYALVDNKWLPSNPSAGEENPYEEDIELDSKIFIDTIYLGEDKRAKWGDNLRVKLKVYKGNTSKESVQIWVKGDSDVVSKRTRFSVNERFKEKDFTIPVQIYPNCNEKYKDGNYELLVSGLNSEDSEKFKIKGLTSSLCKQSKIKKEVESLSLEATKEGIGKESNTEKEDFFESNLNDNNEEKIVFSSKTNKQSKLTIYFFIFLVSTMGVYGVLRND